MKKAAVFTVLFATVFVLTYLALCCMVPGLRIKLAADAFTYFTESIRSLVFFKSLISLAAGTVVCGLLALFLKIRR